MCAQRAAEGMAIVDWRWRFLDADGQGLSSASAGGGADESADGEPLRDEFATQADAETWIGEVWRDLVDRGVDAVQLWHDDSMIYGPMSLRT